MRSYRFLIASMTFFLIFMRIMVTNASVINEVEPNDTFNAPQDINLPAAGGVVAIKGLPSIGVDGNLDFYRFTVPDNAFVIFDIDKGDTGDDSFDSYLVLLDSSGTLIDTQDDDWDDPGSRDGEDFDSKLYHYFPRGGTFYIVVSLCCDATVLDGVSGHIGDYELFITVAAPGPDYVVETEPNDTINTAQDIDLPSTGGEITVRGIPSFGVDGNLDFYRFTVAAGTYVNFDIDNGENVNDSFDSYLVLLDENGALIATQDDVFTMDPGTLNNHDSMLFHYFDHGGTYYIVVSHCCDDTVLDGVSGHVGDYELVITDWVPGQNIMTEVEPNDTFGAPQDIDIPATGRIVIGGLPSIGVDGNLDFYRFTAQAGQAVLFDMDFAEDGGNSDSFDSYLVLLDSDGNVITTADDFYPVDTGSELGDELDSALYYEFTMTGTYYIVVAVCCDATVLDGVSDHIGDYILYISSVLPPGTPDIAAETEPNDTIFSSRDISIPFNGQITVQGEPSATDGNLDFYRFTIATPVTVIFDIDEGIGGADDFDSYLVLFDASGNILYINDDMDMELGLDSGSVSFNDSFMFFDFDTPGDYYLVVSACCDDGVLEGPVAHHIGDYKLVITSVSPSAAEIPTLSEWGMIIMALLLGVFAVYYIRRGQSQAA